jgi:hypothetical protein
MIKMIQALFYRYYSGKLEHLLSEIVRRKKDILYLKEHEHDWPLGMVDWIIYHDELERELQLLQEEADRYSKKLK